MSCIPPSQVRESHTNAWLAESPGSSAPPTIRPEKLTSLPNASVPPSPPRSSSPPEQAPSRNRHEKASKSNVDGLFDPATTALSLIALGNTPPAPIGSR